MNLLKSLISVSFITLVSRILGFLRDMLIASIFGASAFTDAFFIAFKIPNLLCRIFSEEIFSHFFVPVLMEYRTNKNKKYIQDFVAYVFGCIFLIAFFFIIFGVCFSNSLILMIAPGFSEFPEKLILSGTLLKIMFPYILLVSLGSLFGSILNSWNYFFISSFPKIFLNISIIIFSFYFSCYFNLPIFSLAWAVIISGVFRLFYYLPFLYKINMLVLPKITWNNISLLKILKKIAPAILSAFINQISLIINTIFSSLLNSGSISWIYYADRLVEFPIGIFGASLSTILFISLSKSYKIGFKSEYKKLLNWGVKISLIFSFPSACIIFFLAQPLITVLFQYGKFTDFDVLMTQKSLELYSFGVVSFILVKILSSAFYACEEINIPLKISILTLLITQIMNPFLIFYFQHAGLALSMSISSWINFSLLYWKFYKKNILNFKYRIFIFIIFVILSTVIMILILFTVLHFMPAWSSGSFCNKIIRLLFVVFVSGLGYLIALRCFGINLFHLAFKVTRI